LNLSNVIVIITSSNHRCDCLSFSFGLCRCNSINNPCDVVNTAIDRATITIVVIRIIIIIDWCIPTCPCYFSIRYLTRNSISSIYIYCLTTILCELPIYLLLLLQLCLLILGLWTAISSFSTSSTTTPNIPIIITTMNGYLLIAMLNSTVNTSVLRIIIIIIRRIIIIQ